MQGLVHFEERFVDLSRVRLHCVLAGEGPPIVLLHGWPQTWRAWRKVMALLGDSYRLIVPDLTGLGLSSRPQQGYDKQTIGSDIWELVHDALGFNSFDLVGHDWGGPVAFSMALDHSDVVGRLAILDVAIPGDGNATISQGGRRWHHGFHQTPELPEALVQGREDVYLEWFFKNYGAHPDVLTASEIHEYVTMYRQPGALTAGFNYYRAVTKDIADNEVRLRNGKLSVPTLALGGDSGWGRGAEVFHSLSKVAASVQGGVVANCGHWMPEEQPAVLAQYLREFFFRADC